MKSGCRYSKRREFMIWSRTATDCESISKLESYNLTSGNSLDDSPAPAFLLDMLRAGGLIAYLKGGGVLQQ